MRPPRRDVAGDGDAEAIQRHFDHADLALYFPLSVMIPRVDTPPAVTTVHDLQHELYPAFFSRAELAYRRAVYGWTVKRPPAHRHLGARAVDLLERYGLPPERVRTIHLGIDHTRFTPDGRDREALPPLPREPLAPTRTTGGCSTRSRSCDVSGRSSGCATARATTARGCRTPSSHEGT